MLNNIVFDRIVEIERSISSSASCERTCCGAFKCARCEIECLLKALFYELACDVTTVSREIPVVSQRIQPRTG